MTPRAERVLAGLRWSGDGRIVVVRMIAAPRPGGQVQDQRVVFARIDCTTSR